MPHAHTSQHQDSYRSVSHIATAIYLVLGLDQARRSDQVVWLTYRQRVWVGNS
jgi:hypothetical protein